LSRDEKIDRIGCERGALEMTSRAKRIIFNRFFCMKKINKESNAKKKRKK